MDRLAFFTIGILHAPRTDPAVAGFVERSPGTHVASERSVGFIASAKVLGEWGPTVLPAFLAPELEPHYAQTYSLWRDIESVYAFAYAGRHADGLARRAEWFRELDCPGYVAWWVPQAHRPDTLEAVERIETLHREGPSPHAFSFRKPFGPDGQPHAIDRAAVKTMIEINRLHADT